MKTIYILFLSLFLLCGNFLPACDSEKVNANVAPVVDTNACYQKSQNLGDVFIDLNEKSTEGKIFWKDSSATLKKGENEYEWVFEPKNTNKFLPKTGAIKLIGYESLNDFSVSIKDWTFGEEPNEPQVANNIGNGEVSFVYAKLGENYFTSKKPTDAGKYAVKAIVEPTQEFARAEDISAFTINKKEIIADEVISIQNKIFTGSPQKPELKVNALMEDKDYDVSWSYKEQENSEYGNLKDDFVSVGIYKATITGKCNYTGTLEKSFQIFEDTMENQKRIQDETSILSYEQDKQVGNTEVTPTETTPELATKTPQTSQSTEQKSTETSQNTEQYTEQKPTETPQNTDLKPTETAQNTDETSAEKPVESEEIIAENPEDNTAKIEQTNIEVKEEMSKEKQENDMTETDASSKIPNATSSTESKTSDKELLENFDDKNQEHTNSKKEK